MNSPTLYDRISLVESSNPYFQKDLAKAKTANKFIGRGSDASSTNRYRVAAGDVANTSDYEASDRIFVSVEGARRGRIPLDKEEVDKAVQVGATLIADAAKDRLRPYNVGERELADHLIKSHYLEISPGTWSKENPNLKLLQDNTIVPAKIIQRKFFSRK
jgi:hypothetical protein